MSPGRHRARLVAAGAAALLALVPAVAALPAGAVPGAAPGAIAAARAVPAAPAVSPHAAPEALPLVVTISRFLPASPRPGDTLTVAGSVSNPSGTEADSVQVGLRLSPEPLADRAAVAAVASGRDDSAYDRVPGTRIPLTDRLEPGQTVPFTLSIPVDSLPLPRQGVYVAGVEALGAVGDAAATRMGLRRTFLVWMPDPAAITPGGVVSVWPVSQAPAVDDEGVLLNQALPAALAPGGRLRTVLDTGLSVPGVVSWVVDPATLETVDDMTGGYRVVTPTGVQAGDATAAATAWLATARSGLAAADVAALPYADPDDVALVRGGLQRDVVRATTTAAAAAGEELGRTVAATLAWPAGGFVDQATLAVLGDTGADGVLLSGSQLRPDPAVDFTPTGSAALPTLAGSRRAVVADPVLSAVLNSGAATAAQLTLARQRLVAELAMITLELPRTPRTVVMAPPVSWKPSAAWARAVVQTLAGLGWIRPVTLGALLAAPPSEVTRSLDAYPAAAAEAELPPAYVNRLARTERSAATLGEIVGETTGATTAIVGALQRAGSAAWRRDKRTGDALLTSTAATVAETTAKVRILSSGTVSLPGEDGVIPVTVANDLEVPVTVGLEATGEPAVRFESDPVAPVTIEPGRKASIELHARVAGTGQVTAVLQLVTTSGAPYGAPARIEVGSAAYARAAAWVVGAAFLLLLALVAVNTVRRIRVARVHRAQAAAAAAAPDGAGDEDAPDDGALDIGAPDDGALGIGGPDDDGTMTP